MVSVILCILAIMWWNIVMDDRNLDENTLRKWTILFVTMYIYNAQILLHKEWWIMLGLHFVLVTLRGQLTITYRIGDTRKLIIIYENVIKCDMSLVVPRLTIMGI